MDDLDLKALKRRQKQERIRRRREQYDKDRCSDERHQQRRRREQQQQHNELPPRSTTTTTTRPTNNNYNNNNPSPTQTSSTPTPTPTPPLTTTYGAATTSEEIPKKAKTKDERIIETNTEIENGGMTLKRVETESQRRNRLQRIREERKEEQRMLRASQLIQEHLGPKHFEELCGGGGGGIAGGDGSTSGSSDNNNNNNKKYKKNTTNKKNPNTGGSTRRLLPSQQSDASPSGGISPLTQSPSITIINDTSRTGSTPELFERKDHRNDTTKWHDPQQYSNSHLHSTTTSTANKNRKTTSKRCDTKNRAPSLTTATTTKTTTTSLGKRSKKQQTRATTNTTSWDSKRRTIHQFDDNSGEQQDHTNDTDPNNTNNNTNDNTSSFSLTEQDEETKRNTKSTIDDQGHDGVTKPRVLFAELPQTIARVGVGVSFGGGGGGNGGGGDSSSEEDLFAARAYIDRQKGGLPGSSSCNTTGDGVGTTPHHNNKRPPSTSSSTSRWHVGRSKLGTTPGRKNDGNHDGTNDGTSSSSEEEDLYSSARKIRAAKQQTQKPPSKRLHSQDDDREERIESRRSNQRTRNEDDSISPLLPMRGMAPTGTSRGDTRKVNNEDDDLWGDDSDLEVTKASGDIGTTDKRTTTARRGTRRKSRARTDDQNDDTQVASSSSFRAIFEEEEDEDLEQQLKPDFKDPKLGPPSKLEPLVLLQSSSSSSSSSSPLPSSSSLALSFPNKPKCVDSISTTTTTATTTASNSLPSDSVNDRVPASINRYLQEYQREGIAFLYSNVTRNMGAILGDDMGLGKTVQMIALLAALQKKTGTKKDLKLIHQRQVYFERKAIERRNESDLAMLNGTTTTSKLNNTAIEVIESARWKQNSGNFSPCLIVVPPSVITNWSNEFNTWGHFAVSTFQDKEKRAEVLDQVKTGMNDVMICGRALFTRPESFAAIKSVEWKMIVVDEFHEYNKESTQSYKCLLDLRLKCGCPLIGMTGTVMSNNHRELWTLVDLVQPNLLGPWKVFRKHWADPIKRSRAKEAKPDCVKLATKRLCELDAIMKKVYLKRNKSDVLKDTLTTKDEKVLFCCLSDVQKRMYQMILSLPDYESLRMANAPCDCGVNRDFFLGYSKLESSKEKIDYQRRHKKKIVERKKCCYDLPYDPEHGCPAIDPRAVLWKALHPSGEPCEKCPSCTFLPAIQKLYKVCSHPSLLQVDNVMASENECNGKNESSTALEFAKVALTSDILQYLPGKTYIRGDSIMDDHIALSGKMKALDYCLKMYQQQGDRALVFSYSTRSLDMIQHYIKGKGWSFLRLDGTTPVKKRQPLIDQFQRDPSIFLFLISTRAGGIGLNLTAANRVIVFDVNWNPSHDEQAQDRAFRIGQLRDVDVVRLVAQGTIEETMYARQIYKVHLQKQTLGSEEKSAPARIFRGVHKDPNRKGELFGVENLLRYKDGSFMMDLWKKSDECYSNGDDLQQIHRVSDVISKICAEKVQEQLESGEHQEIPSIMKSNDSNGNETKIPAFNVNKVNHEDFLREDRGDAAVRFGDEGYSEEMGGGSQAMHDVIAKKSTEFTHGSRSLSCSPICEADEEEISGKRGLVKKVVKNLERDDKIPLPLNAQHQILDNKSPSRKEKQAASTINALVNNDHTVNTNVPEKLGLPEILECSKEEGRALHAIDKLGKSSNAKDILIFTTRKESMTATAQSTKGKKNISQAGSIPFDTKKSMRFSTSFLYNPKYPK